MRVRKNNKLLYVYDDDGNVTSSADAAELDLNLENS